MFSLSSSRSKGVGERRSQGKLNLFLLISSLSRFGWLEWSRNWTSNFQHFNSWQSDIFYSFFLLFCNFSFFLFSHIFPTSSAASNWIVFGTRLTKPLQKRLKRVKLKGFVRICPDIITASTQQWESKKLLSIVDGFDACLLAEGRSFDDEKISFSLQHKIKKFSTWTRYREERREWRRRKCVRYNSRQTRRSFGWEDWKSYNKISSNHFCVVFDKKKQQSRVRIKIFISNAHTKFPIPHTPFDIRAFATLTYLLFCWHIYENEKIFFLSHYHYHHAIDFSLLWQCVLCSFVSLLTFPSTFLSLRLGPFFFLSFFSVHISFSPSFILFLTFPPFHPFDFCVCHGLKFNRHSLKSHEPYERESECVGELSTEIFFHCCVFSLPATGSKCEFMFRRSKNGNWFAALCEEKIQRLST